MITVTKIVGESVDLTNNTQVAQGVTLSNGQREVIIPLSEDSLRLVMELWLESVKKVPPAPHHEEGDDEEEPVSIGDMADKWKLGNPSPPPPVEIDANGVEFVPAVSEGLGSGQDDDEDGDFTDEFTGVPSA